MRILTLLAVMMLPTVAHANQCEALKPTPPGDTSVNFSGEVEGKLGGIIGNLTGGIAQLKGDYERAFKDALPHYKNSDKLFIWQRLLYLACINPNSKIKLNELLQAYLIGPPSIFGAAKAPKKKDVDVRLVGIDRQRTYQHSPYNDMIFAFTNNTDQQITIGSAGADQCEFKNFHFPGQRPFNATARIYNIGPLQVPVAPKKTALIAFGINRHFVGPLSYQARTRSYSQCSFQILGPTIGSNLIYKIPSQPGYVR